MELCPDRFETILDRLVESGVTDRHRRQEHRLYTDVYGIDGDNPDLKTLFDIAIQNRARGMTPSDYAALSKEFEDVEFHEYDSRDEAFADLNGIENLGPKIVDEFLRKVVNVFGVNPQWEDDLHVPLDTHVVKALVKTGAIDLEGEDWDSDLNRNYQRVVNMNPSPECSPTKKVAYHDLQEQFRKAAKQHELPRIVFDELWIEHSHFISNPLLQPNSSVSDLILKEFRY